MSSALIENLLNILPDFIQASKETGIMLLVGLSSAAIFGGALGTFLYLWREGGLLQNRVLYFLVGGLVNVTRSFPFVILMITVIPLTKKLAGTSIGPLAAAVPLSIAAIAYFARLVELALNEIPRGVIEAAESMGASVPKIVFSVLYVEARSPLILALTSLTVSFLSYTAAAGIVGGGGIGDLAIRFGYYRFQTEIMVVTTLTLILLVQLIQVSGNILAKQFNHK
jgi:D-methionine transport system permease protein